MGRTAGRTLQDTDGIHVRLLKVRSVDGRTLRAADRRAYEDAILVGATTFESEIAALVNWFQPLVSKTQANWPKPDFYARRVLRLINRIRHDLLTGGLSEQTVVLAFRLGREATDAGWRLEQGPRVRAKLKANRDANAAAKHKRPARRSKYERQVQQAAELRQKNPNLSNNALALRVAPGASQRERANIAKAIGLASKKRET